MKFLKIILVVVVAAAIINFVRGGDIFPLPQVLPFCGGHAPSVAYDVMGGLGLIALCGWGLKRLHKTHSEASENPSENDETYKATFTEQSDPDEDSDVSDY